MLENINISSKDRIKLREVKEASNMLIKHINILGYSANEYIVIQKEKICLLEDIVVLSSECRIEGFINGYITAVKMFKGEVL